MLEIRYLTKLYSGIPAVENVSFIATAGEVTGYLGPNGSGKSTTVKILTGLIEPNGGEVLYCGEPIHRDLIGYKRRLGYVPEEAYIYLHLTIAEYLELVGQLRCVPQKQLQEKIHGLLTLFSLLGDRYIPISACSKAMRQKIILAAALLHNPEIVFLDEPFCGLDVNSALILRSLIRGLAARGKVVLLSSHVLDTVERVCSRVVILHKGHVLANDSIARLRELMSLPTLEEIFSQLAVQQDTEAIAKEILDYVEL